MSSKNPNDCARAKLNSSWLLASMLLIVGPPFSVGVNDHKFDEDINNEIELNSRIRPMEAAPRGSPRGDFLSSIVVCVCVELLVWAGWGVICYPGSVRESLLGAGSERRITVAMLKT